MIKGLFGKGSNAEKEKKNQSEVLRTNIHSLVGKGTTVDGVLHFMGGLHVIGTVNGGVSSPDKDSLLIVSEDALITGDVKVNHLILNGTINGNVFVDGKVELFDKARINGDVHYHLLELPVGAEVNGKLIREEEKKLKIVESDVDDRIPRIQRKDRKERI